MSQEGAAPAPDLEKPLHEILATDREGTQQHWMLCLYSDRFTMAAPGGDVVHQATREEMSATVLFHEKWPVKSCLQIQKPKKYLLQLAAGDFATLLAWRGPATRADLKAALRRNPIFMIPLGLWWISRNLPASGDVQEIEPLDQIDLALAIALVAIGLLPFLLVHRLFFLLVIAWCAAFCLDFAYSILVTGASPWWCLGALIMPVLMFSSLRAFRRFGSVLVPTKPEG